MLIATGGSWKKKQLVARNEESNEERSPAEAGVYFESLPVVSL